MYGSDQDLKGLNLTGEAVLTIALDNLRSAARAARWMRGKDVMSVVLDDNYEASLLLLDDIWPQIEEEMGGPIVVAAPARNGVAVVRADNRAALSALRAWMCEDFPYRVSRVLLRRENGRWVITS